MLSPDDNPGVFYFLVGTVVLVLTAVGLSMVLEQRFKYSSGAGEIKRDIAAADADLANLRSTHEMLSRQLDGGDSMRGSSAAALREARGKVTESARRRTGLQASREQLQKVIASTEDAFSNYRSTYLSKVRAAAVGEEIGDLKIRGGRDYHQVSISKVTDVGLEIRHEHGIARIQAPDLDPAWQERFQWNDEERRARLEEEAIRRESLAAAVPEKPLDHPQVKERPVAELPKVSPAGAAPEDADLQLLRNQLIGWRTKVSRLRRDRNEAASNASSGSGHSVPGRLETWVAKRTRLDKELARAQVELSVAMSKLAAVSPSDPLLQFRMAEDR